MPTSVYERVGRSDNDYSLERTSSGSSPQSTGNALDTQTIQSGSQIRTNGGTANSQEESISTDEQSPRSEFMPPDREADDEVRTPATSPATHGAEDNPQDQQTEPDLSDMLQSNLSAEDLEQFNKYFEVSLAKVVNWRRH